MQQGRGEGAKGLHIRYRQDAQVRPVDERAKENPPIGWKGGCDLGVSPWGSVRDGKKAEGCLCLLPSGHLALPLLTFE